MSCFNISLAVKCAISFPAHKNILGPLHLTAGDPVSGLLGHSSDRQGVAGGRQSVAFWIYNTSLALHPSSDKSGAFHG